MRHRKFVHAPLEIEFKSSVNKEWNRVTGFRNIAKALRWVKSTKLNDAADEIRLSDPLESKVFLYSPDQHCFREIV